ncbi:MAG: hypothetical protein HRF50_17960 [Phycisphaerae bacterium]
MLAQPACTALSERDQQFFYARHLWQCAFDALSAACGAGLLTSDFRQDYTDLGRGVLTLIGLLGALAYLFATLSAMRRWAPSDLLVPGSAVVAVFFVGLQLVVAGAAWVALRAATEEPVALEPVWLATAAFASLGWARPAVGVESWLCAAIAGASAFGWPVWLLLFAAWRRTLGGARTFGRLALGYLVYLVALAVAVSVLESPRGAAQPGAGASMVAQAWPARLGRAAVQVVSAAGAGIATEDLTDSGLREGTKVVLVVLVLVGGFFGCAAGGVTWILAVSALRGRPPIPPREPRRGTKDGAFPSPGAEPRGCDDVLALARGTLAALRVLIGLLTTTVVAALGMILIETLTASRFQPAPTFADALVDAASAVCGGGLTTGVTELVTGRNLIKGIGLGMDQYQVGMAWIMLCMVAGRVLPIAVLANATTPPVRSGSVTPS